MNTATQVQFKLNLPLPMKLHIEEKAGRFGLTSAAYIKHLIAKDIEEKDYPVFVASEKTEQSFDRAIKNKKKSVMIEGSLEDYFANKE